MGKKSTNVAEKEKDEVAEESSDEFEEETPDLPTVELGDFVKVKQVLDETVVKAMLELDFTENHYWDNIKLALMVVACLFAMVAQFYPMPFPDSRPLLGVCCAAYFAASSVLQLIVTYIEKNCIMITGAEGAGGSGGGSASADSSTSAAPCKNKGAGAHGLRLCTDLPRFSYDFTVAVMENVPADEKAPPPNTSAMTFKIHDYFTEEGLFDEARFMRHVQSVVKDYQNGEYYEDRTWGGAGASGGAGGGKNKEKAS